MISKFYMAASLMSHGGIQTGGVASPETAVFKALSGSRGQGSRFRVQGSRFRVQGSGFRAQGSGF